MNALKVNDVTVSCIEFSKFKKKSFSTASYKDEKFKIQLPKLRMPFNMKDYNGNLSFELNITEDIQKKLEEIDSYVVQYMYDHRKEWDGEDYTFEDLVDKQYSSTVKQSNVDYPPYIRIKIGKDYNGNIKSSFFSSEKDENGKYMPIDIGNNPEDYLINLLQRNTEMQVSIECGGLWVRDGKFGLMWRLEDMKVYPKSKVVPRKATTIHQENDSECLFD